MVAYDWSDSGSRSGMPSRNQRELDASRTSSFPQGRSLPGVDGTLLHQENRTSPLDFAGDPSMEMRWHPGDPTRQNFATFSHEFLKKIWIFVVDGLGGNIDATARHNPVCPSEIRSAFGIFRFHYLFHLPVKSASAQERVVLFLFQSARGIRTFFITRRDVTRNRLAFRFRLRALDRNDISRHDS